MGIIMVISGGGARSAAFGYGVLSALAKQSTGNGRTLVDSVEVIGGVSGGAVLAAAFALHGPAGLGQFQRSFLLGNPEADLETRITPANLVRAYRGGLNDNSTFPAWLDKHLFHGARLGDLLPRPRLVIHATEIHNRTPFIFDRETFQSICSNYDDFPLSQAVAASAAVPVVFAPAVLTNFSRQCPTDAAAAGIRPARWRATGKTLIEQEYRNSVQRYVTDPDLNYLKLYDGGLVDGVGTASLTLLMQRPAPEPLSALAARRIKRLLVVLVDASTRWGGNLSHDASVPSAPDAVIAAVDAMINGPNLAGVDRLKDALPEWKRRFAAWKCRDSGGRLCSGDITLDVARVALTDVVDRADTSRILALHNRLTLAAADVSFLSDLGHRLLQENGTYQRFIGRLK